MPTVETTSGPIDSHELGRTLCHEHVFVRTMEVEVAYGTWDHDARVAEAVDELRGLVETGVSTIVDPTCLGLGRDVVTVLEVLEQVPGLRAVVATGLYTYDSVPHAFAYTGPGTLLGGDEPLVELFVRDATEGIQGTGVKAGIIKCATDEPGMTPDVERVMRACAAAHHRTGLPIWTHSHPGTGRGLEQVAVLRDAGVDPEHVLIGHSGDTADLDYLERLLATGASLGMDRFGLDIFLPFEQRVATVAALCARGYAGRMALSHDASCHIDWLPAGAKEQIVPSWHYRHIEADVLPALRSRGVTDDQIDAMLVEAPARLLAGA